MNKRTFISFALILAVSTAFLPELREANAAAPGLAAKGKPEGPLTSVRADASCHNPCDKPFQLTAMAKDSSGRPVKGAVITFKVELASGTIERTATTNGSGKAEIRFSVNPATAPQGELVIVTVTAQKNGTVKTTATSFTPDYR